MLMKSAASGQPSEGASLILCDNVKDGRRFANALRYVKNESYYANRRKGKFMRRNGFLLGIALGFTVLFGIDVLYADEQCKEEKIQTVLASDAYKTRMASIETLKKIEPFKSDYNVYEMDIKYDYNSDNIIGNFTDTESFVKAVAAEALPGIPFDLKLPNYGCTAFVMRDKNGEVFTGRNYDFKLDTSALLVRCQPKNGYKSMGFAALNNVGADNADSSIMTKLACLFGPYICNDGVNEKGVSIAVLTLDSEPTNQNNGKKKIATSLAIRLVLDNADSTQKAVDILREYDMVAANGRDYHFFIADSTGDSRVVEWDCMSPTRELVETKINAITNFYAKYIGQVKSYQRNGIYGHGRERYDKVITVLENNKDNLTKEVAWEALKSASSAPNPESVTSNTQWSVIFSNTNLTADMVQRRLWDTHYSFNL